MLETVRGFIIEHWRAPVEVGILAVVIYYLYLYLRGTHGARILIGLAIVFLTLTFISQFFDLVVIGWILRSLSVFVAIALVVIFQPELRRLLTEIGSHRFFTSAFEKRETVEEVTDTVFELSSKGFGALLAVERDINLRQIVETGVLIDSDFSKELVLTIFHPRLFCMMEGSFCVEIASKRRHVFSPSRSGTTWTALWGFDTGQAWG